MVEHPVQEEDPFNSLLTLEDTLYTSAYTSGVTAGAHSGRIEGRIFGLEKGFEKYSELGHLHGRSQVWGSRLPGLSTANQGLATSSGAGVHNGNGEKRNVLPLLGNTARLQSNTTLLHSLTDPDTFSTLNTEEAVADFDDRFKRAGAKAKVIERIIGEGETMSSLSLDGSPAPARGKSGPVRVTGDREKKGKKGDDSIEDFAGSRLLR